MNITNDIKKKLIIAMISHAAKKQAKATVKSAQQLHALWKELFSKHIELHIPELPRDRWAALIQAGTLTPITGEQFHVYPHPKSKPDKPESLNEPAGYADFSIENAEVARLKWHDVVMAVNDKWGGMSNIITVNKYGNTYKFYWPLRFADLPHAPAIRYVFSPEVTLKDDDDRAAYSAEAYPLQVQAKRLSQLYCDVVIAAGAMYDDLTDILGSIRTFKQLEAQFPEAVPFLPNGVKPKNVQQIADPTLISRARQMLVSGIPN